MTHADELLIQRFLDGELSEAEAAQLRERLKNEPRLRLQLSGQREIAKWFAAARAEEPGTPPVRPAGPVHAAGGPAVGFAGRVLARARGDAGLAPTVRMARGIALAAAFVIGLSLLWTLALLDRGRGRTLDASGDELRREVDRLERVELPPEAQDVLSGGGVRPASPAAAPESRAADGRAASQPAAGRPGSGR